jgi:outer membrane protein assembly factor BamD
VLRTAAMAPTDVRARALAGLLALPLSGLLLGGCASTPPAAGEESSSEDDAPPSSDTGFGAGGFNTGTPGSGMGQGPGQMGPPSPRGDGLPTVTFEATAEANWAKAEEAFKDEDYPLAQRYYAYVRSKYPYSQYALLCDLRVADCLFGRERWLEAIDAYQSFVRMHPTHEDVPYAHYRIALGFHRQIPGDWFLIPPSQEKDQTAVRDAERALRDFLERYPSDARSPDAARTLAEVRGRLMAHERYAADFYKNLGRERAFVGRLEVIRRDFADVALDDALLLEIAGAWARLSEPEKVRSAVAELEAKFPGSARLREARALLAGSERAAPVAPTRTSSAAGS